MNPYIKPLLSKNFFQWKKEEVEPIIKILSTASSIDSHLSSYEALSNWKLFQENFLRYLSIHHDVLKKIGSNLCRNRCWN